MHIHIYIYICVCEYVYICIHIYMCTHKEHGTHTTRPAKTQRCFIVFLRISFTYSTGNLKVINESKDSCPRAHCDCANGRHQ